MPTYELERRKGKLRISTHIVVD